jgi:AraC-like DNA-binding protein
MATLARHKLLIGATTLAVATGGGVAYAATQAAGTSRQAFINDVAKRLHVQPTQLTDALKAALLDRLAAEVKAGRITQAQADRIEKRIDSGKLPLFFAPPRPGPMRAGVRAALPAAAHYLGLRVPQLLSELRSGKSLAQIATARGKSVSGLEQAIMSAEQVRLNRAVANGRITKTREQQLLARLSSRISRLVNRTGWGRPPLGPAPPHAAPMIIPGPPAPGGGGPATAPPGAPTPSA